MVEAEREGALGVEGAAEAHAAEQREAIAALDQQTNELEEILVPAHRDPILGDAAKAGHHALVERLVERGDIADGIEGHTLAERGSAGQRGRQRLDLQAIDADHGVPVVEKMMRERESCRAHADHEHPLPVGSARYRTAESSGFHRVSRL